MERSILLGQPQRRPISGEQNHGQPKMSATRERPKRDVTVSRASRPKPSTEESRSPITVARSDRRIFTLGCSLVHWFKSSGIVVRRVELLREPGIFT